MLFWIIYILSTAHHRKFLIWIYIYIIAQISLFYSLFILGGGGGARLPPSFGGFMLFIMGIFGATNTFGS